MTNPTRRSPFRAAPSDTGQGGTPKVLLVDDRRDNLVALAAILQGLSVEPVAVDSGDAALKRLLMDDFAVILMDAQMPNMDGFETARRIKERERTRNVPIIFLTAADRDAELALRGYAAGAVDYLTKPLDPWVLRSKVSVFADLWSKTRQVAAQARNAESASVLLTAVDAAIGLLQAEAPDVTGALSVLECATAKARTSARTPGGGQTTESRPAVA
ncbi:MAG TPA: response regulator [Micromonosporaceae bacterium]|jgi:CheY-like chemotaxis protein